jgi:hypothetical protein
MPQLSLYLDEKTLKKVEKAARISKVSVSKWVRSKLMRSLQNEWPEDYFELFGAISDDSFRSPEEPSSISVVPREAL